MYYLETRQLTATIAALCALHLTFFAGDASSQDAGTLGKEKARHAFGKRLYSPYANRNFPTRPFFGDTHLHTSFSFDAGVFGARLTPRDAYRFARGEQVNASTDQR